MTINTTSARIVYTGNGVATTWSIPFTVPQASYLVVTLYDTVAGITSVVSSSAYSVSGLPSTGILTYPLSGTPIPATQQLIIQRVVPLIQSTDFVDQGAFYADTVENGFDYLTMALQQQQDQLDRALIASASGDLDLAGARVINLGAPVSATDAVRFQDLQAAQVVAGNVPTPAGGDVGQFLKATNSGAGSFSWESIQVTDVSDSTTIGRQLMLAASQAAARSAIGAAASGTATLIFILGYANVPPVSPSTNDVWAVAGSPTGAWATHGNTLATWNGSAWTFATPDGGTTYVNVITGRKFFYYNSAWLPDPADPAGIIKMSGSNVIPAGHLECDGSAISRTTYLLLFQALVRSATITVTIAAPGVVSWTAHGLRVGDPVVFSSTGALPTGITAGTTYYVSSVVNANSFQIATAAGGASLTTSGSQSGTHTGVNAPHGAGDGSTTFNLPNGQGEFFRGLDNGRGVDTNRVMGSAQGHQLQDHLHSINVSSVSAVGAGATNGVWNGSGSKSTGNPSSGNHGSETRPRNITGPYIIRY